MIILLPPSEGKAEGGTNPPLKTIKQQTRQLLKEIKQADPQKLYGLKDKALQKAIEANNTITKQKTLPAIQRYTGVVYDGLDYQSLNKTDKQRADKHIRIVSALFGLVKPTDNLPDYKLKIDKLKAAQTWQPVIEEELKNEHIIDLLPQAHKKTIPHLKTTQVEFVIIKNGKKIPAGHAGKLVKGKFVRHLVQNKAIESFKEDGFAYKKEEDKVVFIKR